MLAHLTILARSFGSLFLVIHYSCCCWYLLRILYRIVQFIFGACFFLHVLSHTRLDCEKYKFEYFSVHIISKKNFVVAVVCALIF